MAAVSRVGDTSTHGGSIITGSPNLKANGSAVARIGDILQCQSHGPRPLVSTPVTKTFNQGKLLITVGAKASCGATITTGSPTVNVE